MSPAFSPAGIVRGFPGQKALAGGENRRHIYSSKRKLIFFKEKINP
jgi:hypothetical protein